MLLLMMPVLALGETKDASLVCGLSLSHIDASCANEATGIIMVELTTNETGTFIFDWVSGPTSIPSSTYVVNAGDINPVTGLFQGNIYTATGLSGGVYDLEVTTPSGDMCFAQATIFVVDFYDPIIICPSDVVVPNEPGMCDTTLDVPIPVVIDSCNASVQVVAPSQLSSGSNSITYTATDSNGNSSTLTCNVNVVVIDVEDPIINCPSSISTTITDGGCSTSVTWGLTASDNCGISNINTNCIYPDGSQAPCSSGDEYPIGTTVVVNSAIDNSGNVANCAFQISVNDATPNNLFFTGNISNGIYYANQDIISNGNVPNSGDVHFKAGQCVQLNGGFSVQPNADFSAEINDCN